MKSSMTTTTTVAAGHHQYRGIQEEAKEEDFDYIIEEVDGYLASIRQDIENDLSIIGELNAVMDSDG